jgi:hypothetical protein
MENDYLIYRRWCKSDSFVGSVGSIGSMGEKTKKGFVMEKKFIIVIGLIVLFVFTLLYWTRFQVIDVHAMNGVGFYKINRLTGETVLVSGLDQIRVLPVKDLEQPQLQLPAPGKGQ